MFMLGTSGFDIILLCWNGNSELISTNVITLPPKASYRLTDWHVQYVIPLNATNA